MVDMYTSFSVINKSLSDLSLRINNLVPAEEVKIKESFERFGEDDTYITERSNKLNVGVAIAYNLSSYRKNFYLMDVEPTTSGLFGLFKDKLVECDMTEFNLEGDDSGFIRNNF